MLKLFRERKVVARLLLVAIVGVIGFAMVVGLVPGVVDGGGALRDPQVLARVGDAVVTQAEVQREYQRRVQQLGTQSPVFRQLILENLVNTLITQRVVEYEAQRLGIEVTPQEVAAALRQFSVFYPGGQFVGAESYRQLLLQQFEMSVPQFEDRLRGGRLADKLLAWVTGGLSVSPAEVEQEYRRRNERVRIEYVLFRPQEFAQGVRPRQEDLRGYYDRNRDRYQLPERRKVRFVGIDFETLRRRVAVSGEELEAYYRRQREHYRLPERVRARHILFLRGAADALGAPQSPAGQPAGFRQEAEKVLAQLHQGKDFAALARKYSQDSVTREKGGEIGWVQRGQTVPALEEVLFSLPPGSPAKLVETSYGVHIVQVLAHQPERVKSLAEVRGEIEPVLKDRKVRQRALEEAQSIVEAVRAGKTLEDAAKELGWPVRESPLFPRNAPLPQLGESQEFQDAAFRLPAESAGQPTAPVSEPVAVRPGYVLLQLEEVSPAHVADFEEVRVPVARAYREERGAEGARGAAQRLAAQAEKSGGLRRPARQEGWAVKTTQSFGREGSLPELGPAADIAPVAFSLGVGEVSPAFPVGGNWMVLRVIAREEADPSRLSSEEKKNLRNALLDQKRGLAWAIFTESVKKRLLAEGKLQLNQAAISRLTRQS
ncbi:MAG: peptidyl-prolyl cis-trans isomerase [Terriglobia bacterium]